MRRTRIWVEKPMGLALAFMLVAASFWLLNTYRDRKAAEELAARARSAGVEPVEVGPQTLAQLLTQGKPAVLQLFSPSDADCAKMVPDLAALNAAYGNGIFVLKLNVEKYPDEARKLGVSVVPTVLLYDASGTKKAALAGYRGYNDLLGALKDSGLVK